MGYTKNRTNNATIAGLMDQKKEITAFIKSKNQSRNIWGEGGGKGGDGEMVTSVTLSFLKCLVEKEICYAFCNQRDW